MFSYLVRYNRRMSTQETTDVRRRGASEISWGSAVAAAGLFLVALGMIGMSDVIARVGFAIVAAGFGVVLIGVWFWFARR